MDFTAACGYVMPLGKHQGKSIARIGSNREGLLYLDWLVGQDWVRDNLRMVLETYLKHPAISRELEAAIGD
jgi:uncharacterized protein (DUF3820 family)